MSLPMKWICSTCGSAMYSSNERGSPAARAAAAVEVVLQRRQVADRRVEPDVEVLVVGIGDADAEVGRVARDVPVGEPAVAELVDREPFADLVQHLGLQPARRLRPFLQEGQAAGVRQVEEVVLARLHHRRRAGQRRVRMLQLGRRIDRAADLAGVAVLVLRAAARALALDVAVGQEHRLHRVEELLDGARRDQLVPAQREVDVLRQPVVLRAVGRMPVVELDVEAVEIALAPGGDLGDEFLRRPAGLLGGDHDRRAVGVVGADEMHPVAAACAGSAPRCRPGCTPSCGRCGTARWRRAGRW